MKKNFLVFFIFILALVLVSGYNNNPKIIISRISSMPAYKNGIRCNNLKYRVYLLGIMPIGDAALIEKTEEYKGQKVYHLSASAESLKIISKIFSSSAALDSYVDAKKFNPVIFRQKLRVSGKKDTNKEVIYNQQEGVMLIAGVRRQIFPDTQDPLSAVFNLRRMDFSEKKGFEMNLNANQKNYILKGTASPKDIAINKAVYKTVFLKAEISRHDKNPYHKSKVDMVLMDEKQNIPVLIKVFAGGILINAKLTRIECP